VSCEKKKKKRTILAAQRTSIARLMTTITSSGPQRHRRIPTPLCRPTDGILRICKKYESETRLNRSFARRWKDPRQQERRIGQESKP